MAFFRIDPITRKRFRRFRQIKRGWYSLVLLLTMIVLSLFSEYIANDRAIIVSYQGSIYFPTWKFYPMEKFNQMDDFGLTDVEANYRLMREQFEASELPEEERLAFFEEKGYDSFFAELLVEQVAEQGTGNWILMPPIPYDPIKSDFNYEQPPPNPPDGKHILGTDSQGRDVFARLLYGFRISIFFSLAVVSLALVIGTIIGCLQGYISGWFDILSQRFIEIWMSLPFLYVVIILALLFGASFWLLVFAMVLFTWMGITFYMRTEMYREKTREYCLAAKSMGASHGRIVFKHLLPNALVPLVTFAPFMVVTGIFSLTALDYLGYGLPAPTPSWGELIQQSMDTTNRDKLWLSLSPFFAISITLLLVTFVGESIREAFDPKQYAKYE